MQPLSREQLNRNRYLRATSFEGKTDLGDTFRRAKGDAASARAMASIDDGGVAGENEPLSAPFTVPAATATATAPSPPPTSASDAEMNDGVSSSCSSPPTHPAFFPRMTAVAAKHEVARPGKENACPAGVGQPTPMVVAFSPLGSPLAVLMSRRSPALQKSAADGAGGSRPVMLSRFIDDCRTGARVDSGVRGGTVDSHNKDVRSNVNINIIASHPNGDVNGSLNTVTATSKDATNKKSKRKSKKTNNTDVDSSSGHEDQHTPPQAKSYAEATKEDPADEEKREAEKAVPEAPTSATEDANATGKPQPSAAGDMTFAEAVKEDPADVEEKGKSSQGKGKARDDTASGPGSEKPRRALSQASTSIEYPDIQSDADDDGEVEQRRRDKEKAPQILGTRWAPVRVPFKRRLQTAAVLMHCLGIGLSLSIFFLFCAFPPFWPIIIVYLFTILFATDATDGKLKKRKEWARRLPIWTWFAEYFPAKLHKTHDLQPTRKYIFGYHPHGIISHGAWAAFATDALGFSEKFPGITNSLLTLDSNFNLPIYREYVFSMGVLSVSKESITNILTRGGPNNEGMGRAVTIVVGGARESLESQPRTMRLIINERKGFIKLALQTGADLVPVIAFGENDLYDQLDPHRHPWLHGLQRYFLKAWKFTVPLLHGRGIFNYDVGLMPYRRPLNIVVGKPIPVMQTSNPENSEVNRLHDLYTEELQKIWDHYKDEFAVSRKEEMKFLV